MPVPRVYEVELLRDADYMTKPRSKQEHAEPTAAVRSAGPRSFSCATCNRSFTQKNQRHACGTGSREEVLRNRPDAVVRTYDAIEAFVHSLGAVEVVARERYALLRTVRIFADLVVEKDALRVAIHLGREVNAAMFIKVVRDRKKVTHVARLLTEQDVERIKAYLKEAYDFSLLPARE